jgi:hypothetical protein
MTFTEPAVLWALPLGLLPLLLHLLSRRRAAVRDFSDLALLRRVQAQALPRVRLRQWLLAAARSAVIMALIAAYAGPVLSSTGGAAPARAGEASGDGLDLVLLMDRSASMGVVERGRARWAAARDAAAGLLLSLRPADRVACAAFSDRLEGGLEGLPWMTPRACGELLARSAPLARGTDYGPALRAAYARLSERGRDRAVVLLSDGAAHGVRAGLPPPEPGVGLYALSWPGPPSNAAVVAAGPERGSEPDRPVLRAALWSSARADSSWDLWEGGARLGGSPVALAAGAEVVVSATLPGAALRQEDARPSGAARLGAPPAWSGRVESRPDALRADDVFYYSFALPRRPRLLVLHGDPAFLRPPRAGFFLKDLVSGPGRRLMGWDADIVPIERLGAAQTRLADYDAAALADCAPINDETAASLEFFVRAGGGLFLFPGGRGDIRGCLALGRWLPIAVSAAAEPEAARGLRPEPEGPFASWGGFELDKVAFTRRLELAVPSGGKVWLRTPAGSPLLAGAGHGSGRVLVWAAGLDAASGNLPVKPVYAALVGAGLSLLREPGEGARSFAVKAGEPIVRTWASGEPAPARVRVRSPEGRFTGLWVKGRRMEFTDTARPGLYVVEEEGAAARTYAVNLDRGSGESDLRVPDAPPWTGLRADRLLEDFWLKVRGREGRTAALAAAAAFLLLEMLLALPRALLLLALLLGSAAPAAAQQGDRFVWTQLRHGPTWDPYPDAPAEALGLLGTVTSVLAEPQRRVITLKDPALFESPLVILAGREAPPPLDAEEGRRLRSYLSAGGMLWIEDTSGLQVDSFDRWVRGTLKAVLPEAELAPLPNDHVVFRTFFLLRGAAGRVMVRGTLEGVSWGGRTAVVYSRNDLLGAWAKDALGRPLLPCVPGGEAQRHNARKLTLDILMYSLTGSYKADAVHQPFILQKMRLGLP